MGLYTEIDKTYSKLQSEIFSILFSNDKNKRQKIYEKSIKARDIGIKWAKDKIPLKFEDFIKITANKLEKLDKLKVRKFDADKDKFVKSRISGLIRRFKYIHSSIMFFTEQYISQDKKTSDFMKKQVQNLRIKKFQIQNYANPVDFRKTAIGKEVKKEVRKGLNIFERFTKTGYLYRATLSRGEIEKNLRRLYQQAFGDIDFIAIQMKNGKIRRYNVKKYIHMVTRTEMRYINSKAVIQASKEHNNDLVRVLPEFSGCSNICPPFAGNIYSISGKSKEYPVLSDEPPYHPHCRHSLQPVTVESIRLDKIRERLAA